MSKFHFFNNIVKANDKVLEKSLNFALSPDINHMSYSNKESLYATIGRALVLSKQINKQMNGSFMVMDNASGMEC